MVPTKQRNIMLSVCLTIIYLLVGFQFGARVFFWGRRIGKHPDDFIVPLIIIPLMWPMFVIMLGCVPHIKKAFSEWDGPT
jgi:hypothetical protein